MKQKLLTLFEKLKSKTHTQEIQPGETELDYIPMNEIKRIKKSNKPTQIKINEIRKNRN
jgi:hypothetical protein